MGLKKDYSREFEYYAWGPYPKKVGKQQASKEWDKLGLAEDEMREFREHVEVRKRQDKKWLPNKEGNTFIPDLERFLKHRRFEDDYEKVSHKTVHEKRYYDVEPEPEEGPVSRNPEVAKAALSRLTDELKGVRH